MSLDTNFYLVDLLKINVSKSAINLQLLNDNKKKLSCENKHLRI